MRSNRFRPLGAVLLAVAVAGATTTAPVTAGTPDDSAAVILEWNQHTLGAIATAEAPPAHASLYLAMVHGAVYDAVASIIDGYQPYLGTVDADATASPVAAAAVAAHDVLAATFPDQAAALGALLEASLIAVPGGPEKDAGVAVGMAAAQAMLAAREGDGRGVPNPITPGTQPGEWRPTPPDLAEFPGSWIAKVTPFLAESAAHYRTEGPRSLESAEYALEYDEVRTLGSKEGSTRDEQQGAMMAFWIGPVPQWSAVERALATEKGLDIGEAARLFALANLAAADASIGCFDDKYHWMFWRPITAIHEAASDGNPATEADPAWEPVAPAPPYPDHPSGFNCLAGAHVGALQAFFGTDEMAFRIENPDITPPREYASFTQGLDESIELRIYQGLHFRSAEVQGAQLGLKAAALAAERLPPPAG